MEWFQAIAAILVALVAVARFFLDWCVISNSQMLTD